MFNVACVVSGQRKRLQRDVDRFSPEDIRPALISRVSESEPLSTVRTSVIMMHPLITVQLAVHALTQFIVYGVCKKISLQQYTKFSWISIGNAG